MKFELQEQLGKYPLVREIGSSTNSSTKRVAVSISSSQASALGVKIGQFLLDGSVGFCRGHEVT